MADKLEKLKQKYVINIREQLRGCDGLGNKQDMMEIFKHTIILFIKEIQLMYNQISETSHTTFTECASKMSDLNMVLNCLESNGGMILGQNCVDLIFRSYFSFVYMKYKQHIESWDINRILSLNINQVRETVEKEANDSHSNKANEYFNIIPELINILHTIEPKKIIKILYFLNLINGIIEICIVRGFFN